MGKVTFDLVTKGAVVTLVCQCPTVQRKTIPSFPIRVSFNDPTERWQVRATKRGFEDHVEDIRFERGATEKSITIDLVPKSRRPVP